MSLPNGSMLAASEADSSRSEAPVWHLALTTALASLGFFLPFSTAGVAISSAVLVVLTLLRPRPFLRAAPWREPVMAVGLVLLAYIALHTLVKNGLQVAGLHAINGYQELLLAPILLALLQDPRDRQVLFRALVVGAVFVALWHWVALLDPWWLKLAERGRISAGFALSLCAFLLVLRARGQPRPWPARALAAFLALTVLFAMGGRTGYLILLLLASCTAWVHASRRWRWIAAVVCPAIVVAVALGSGVVGDRIDETVAGSQPAGPDGEFNSTTIRLELLKIAGDLVERHGLTGAGFANYAAAHEAAARQRYRNDPAMLANPQARWVHAENPHDEYILQLVGGGVLALALFLSWFALALRRAARARPPVGGMLAGVVLAFALGCVFNSMLRDFVEAHLYVALLAWLVAESRAPATDPSHIGRVLVVATRQIGDVLLTTPLLQAARARWPDARIDVLAFAGTTGMLRGNRDVNQLLESPPGLGWRGVRWVLGTVWRRYDLALIADPGDRAHLMGWLAAPRRSGVVPQRSGSNWIKRRLLDHVVVSAGDLGEVHVTAEKLSLLAPWLAADAPAGQVVPPPAAPLPAGVRERVQPGAVVVHAPSMWPYKQWPIEHFRQLVAALLAQGRQVILTGSGSERDQQCIAPLRALASSPQLLDLSGKLDFNQLAALLQQAALYIGPDTSVSHLAAATGVPVIAIFGPTNPMRWAPWPARAEAQALFARSAAVQQVGNVTLLQGTQGCVPCGRAGCEDHRQSRSDCLQSITPAQVLAEAARILGAPHDVPRTPSIGAGGQSSGPP